MTLLVLLIGMALLAAALARAVRAAHRANRPALVAAQPRYESHLGVSRALRDSPERLRFLAALLRRTGNAHVADLYEYEADAREIALRLEAERVAHANRGTVHVVVRVAGL